MSTIQTLLQQAQLAEAAYADFLAFPDRVTDALIDEGFSDTQATDFVAKWSLVNQFSDTASGFSATLFESLDDPGQYVFAVRGTAITSWEDVEADVSLATGGVAFDQLVSMVNYVLRLQAGSSGQTQQVELVAGATAPSLTSETVSGIGPGIDPAQLTITGHPRTGSDLCNVLKCNLYRSD